ncbi:hypothetical protein VT84_08625 [Gemmata sp. SH-PL17]|nr:hypothetical protein VT84_08625 [Gemmata sp. SH-PL17]
MSTPERKWKHIQRRLRSIPVEEIAPRIAAEERHGLWCFVAHELEFIPRNGATCETCWDDQLEAAQFLRWVLAHPERVHPTREAALDFVQAHFAKQESA